MDKKKFIVRNVRDQIISTLGGVDSGSWDQSFIMSDFQYPWENGSQPEIEFKAIHDGSWLHCKFQVIDKNVKTHVATNSKQEVLYSDRVELFFATNWKLEKYYCLEIDPLGRVYDYEASFYRKFNDAWQWPSGDMVVQTNFSERGYDVEVGLSLNSLRALGLVNNNEIITGLFRGQCTEVDLQNEKMRWISWVHPNSTIPDFHIPEAFGIVVME